MKKLLSAPVLALLLSVGLLAQQPVPPLVTAQRFSLPLLQPPQQITSAGVSVIGTTGQAVYYYWVVSNFTVGKSGPAGPYIVNNAPNTLSSSNYNQVSWRAVAGAASYDVLRTNTPLSPSGACACAVATAVSGTQQTDQSASLNAYTVTTLDPTTLQVTLANDVGGAGLGKLDMYKAGNSTPVFSVDTAGNAALTGLIIGSGPAMTQAPVMAIPTSFGSFPASPSVLYEWIPSSPILISRLSVFSSNSLAGCTALPNFEIHDASAGGAVIASLTTVNGSNFIDSGSLSATIPSGHTVQLVLTAETGCTTNINWSGVVQYQMQ